MTQPGFLIPMLVVYFYWLVVFTFVGMYRTWFASSRLDELYTLFKASFIGIFILFFIILYDDYVHGVSSTTRFVIFLYWGLFLFFVGSGRIFVRSLQRNLLIKGIGRRNAVIVGFNPKAHNIHKTIESHPALGINIRAYAAVLPKNIGRIFNGVKALDTVHNIENIVRAVDAKEIIIALEKHEEDIMIELLSKFQPGEYSLKIVPDLYEIISGQARTSQIYGFPLIDIMPQLMPEWEKKVKRLLDIIVSFLILILTLPVSLAAAIAIKLDSKGPALFIQERMGQNGEEFNMIKFRSMVTDAEKHSGPTWSTKDDPRITKVGKFIRKVRIDELPQMINVLKGK